MFTKEMINDYADKLLIGLTDEEVNTLLDEFDVIKNNMELIDKIPNLKEVEPLHFPYDMTTDTLREDVAEESLTIDEIIQNCDDTIEGCIEVPKVVG